MVRVEMQISVWCTAGDGAHGSQFVNRDRVAFQRGQLIGLGL